MSAPIADRSRAERSHAPCPRLVTRRGERVQNRPVPGVGQSWGNQQSPGASPPTARWWLLELANAAQVSVIVAMLSAVRACAPGVLFVLTDAGAVTYVGAPPGSTLIEPNRGAPFDASGYSQHASAYTTEAYGFGSSKRVHAFFFSLTVAQPESTCCGAT